MNQLSTSVLDTYRRYANHFVRDAVGEVQTLEYERQFATTRGEDDFISAQQNRFIERAIAVAKDVEWAEEVAA